LPGHNTGHLVVDNHNAGVGWILDQWSILRKVLDVMPIFGWFRLIASALYRAPEQIWIGEFN
jgi:hypothetical protein